MSKPTGQTYQLKSFADLLALDVEQVKRFADELPFIVATIKFTNALLHDCGVDGAPVCSLVAIPWCDDGIKSVTPMLYTVKDGEISEAAQELFTIKAVKK